MVSVTKVHSWVVVVKGGRTRICLDTSKLVNPFVPSIPFNLPQFDEVSKYAKQGSYLAKFDLRDFFWNLKVKESDQGLFGVIHTANVTPYCNTIIIG